MIRADTPGLWEIRQHLGIVKTQALIVYALACMAEFVNIDRNLTQPQMMQIAEDVIADFGYMKLEEVKYILKNSVRTEKIFARIDYNIVMEWFRKYAAERAEHCEAISHNADFDLRQSLSLPADDAISFDVYVATLERKAACGDTSAKDRLRLIEDLSRDRRRHQSASQAHENELAFRQYYHNYLRSKK